LVSDFFTQLLNDIPYKVKGKNWFIRLPLLAYFFYVFIRHWHDPAYRSIIGALNLGIHEVGHMVFGMFGEFMGVAGGTLLQLMAPIFGIYNFYRQEDYFAITLCFGWFGVNLYEIARYVADARAMALPLVSPFGAGAGHDWNFLLSRVGLLNFDGEVASCIRFIAGCLMVFCLAAGGWILKLMRSKLRAESFGGGEGQ